MKTTLTFILPEEEEELKDALSGGRYKARIDTLYDEVFRPHLKYCKPLLPSEVENKMQELTDEQSKVIYAIWKKVAEHFEDVLE